VNGLGGFKFTFQSSGVKGEGLEEGSVLNGVVRRSSMWAKEQKPLGEKSNLNVSVASVSQPVHYKIISQSCARKRNGRNLG